jgi:hypothetical protein
LEAKQAISFFINLKYRFVLYHIKKAQSISMKNDQTREKLVITNWTRELDGSHCLWILRHPIDADADWIEKMRKHENNYEYRTVEIDFSSTHFIANK